MQALNDAFAQAKAGKTLREKIDAAQAFSRAIAQFRTMSAQGGHVKASNVAKVESLIEQAEKGERTLYTKILGMADTLVLSAARMSMGKGSEAANAAYDDAIEHYRLMLDAGIVQKRDLPAVQKRLEDCVRSVEDMRRLQASAQAGGDVSPLSLDGIDDNRFGQIHHRFVVAVSLIDFDHREFRLAWGCTDHGLRHTCAQLSVNLPPLGQDQCTNLGVLSRRCRHHVPSIRKSLLELADFRRLGSLADPDLNTGDQMTEYY